MGLFSRSRDTRTDAAIEALDSEIQSRVARRELEFLITIRESDWGRIDRALPVISEKLQIRGHALINVSQEPWAGVAHLQIRSSAPDEVREAAIGTAALQMTEDELTDVHVWMQNEFKKRTFAAAWAIYLRRMELGHKLPASLPQINRFWLSAYPALSAAIIQIGALPERDLAINCAKDSQRDADPSDTGQMDTATHIAELYANYLDPADTEPKAAASWEDEVLAAFTSSATAPDEVIAKIWPLYLACPPGRHAQVGALAVEAGSRAADHAVLADLFARACASQPPQDFDAAGCYWKIIQVIGEAAMDAAARIDDAVAAKQHRIDLLAQLIKVPEPFQIPRMRYYLEHNS